MYDYVNLLAKSGVTAFMNRDRGDRLELDMPVPHGGHADLSHLCLFVVGEFSQPGGTSYRYAIDWCQLMHITGLCKADFAPFVEEQVDRVNLCVREEFPALLDKVKSNAVVLSNPAPRLEGVFQVQNYHEFIDSLKRLFTLAVVSGVAGFIPTVLTDETLFFMRFYMEALHLVAGVVYTLRLEVVRLEFGLDIQDEPDLFYYMTKFNGYRQFSRQLAHANPSILTDLVALLMRIFDWENTSEGLLFKPKADVFPEYTDFSRLVELTDFAPGTTSMALEKVRYKLSNAGMDSLRQEIANSFWTGWMLSERSVLYELEIAKDKLKRLPDLRKASKLQMRSDDDVYIQTPLVTAADVPDDVLIGFPYAINLNERSVVIEEVSSSVTHKSSSDTDSVWGDVSAISVVEEVDELLKLTDGSTGEHSEVEQQTMKDIPVVVEEAETLSWWEKVVNCLSCCCAAPRV